MRTPLILVPLLLLHGCQVNDADAFDAAAQTFNIADDETLVFFQTSGWLDAAAAEWHLPIHGWIYEPEDSSMRKAAFETVLSERYGLELDDPQAKNNFSARLNLLIADNERGKDVVVNLVGRSFKLPPSAANGHFQDVIVVPRTEIDRDVEVITFTAVSNEDEPRVFDGAVRLVPPSGLSVISDIDDTVKISNVTDRKSLLEYTFLRDFMAAPGMAELYQDWAAQGVTFHFVSSSPWQLYPPLRDFLQDEGFPWATFSLKAVRFRDETLFDLFAKGTETKPAAIAAILDRYPARQFVLVGDSGEQDPEVYAELMRQRPDQIQRIYIRNVTDETADNARFTTVFAGIEPNHWTLFENPAELVLPEH